VGFVQASVNEWSLSTLPSPILELQHAPLPFKVLWTRECALTPPSFVVFYLDSHTFESLKELGVCQFFTPRFWWDSWKHATTSKNLLCEITSKAIQMEKSSRGAWMGSPHQTTRRNVSGGVDVGIDSRIERQIRDTLSNTK